MALVSTFGSSDFYSEASSRIAVVRRAERFSLAKTYLFRTLISSPAKVAVKWLTQKLVNTAIRHLDKRSEGIRAAAAWFESEFEEYERRVCDEVRIPSSDFILELTRLQVNNAELLAGCRESIVTLRDMNPTSRVAAAFERLGDRTARLEAIVERYLDLGRAAHNSKTHTRVIKSLDRQFSLLLDVEPGEDDFDAELVALADQALARIKERQHS